LPQIDVGAIGVITPKVLPCVCNFAVKYLAQ
jgi:hypothetical protein